MKKTIKIRIISLIISLSIILSMLPISAMAVVDSIAEIDDVEYSSLQEAFDNVKNDETIKLIDDIILADTVTITETVESGKNFTLDLNGHSIDSSDKTAIVHNGYGSMTITDSSESENGKITSSNSDISADIKRATIRFVQSGRLIITGGKVEHTGSKGEAIHNKSNGGIEILGGTVEATGDSGMAICNNSSGDLNISNAKVQSKFAAIHNQGNGKISISNNAEIISETECTISSYADGSKSGDISIEITNGVVKNTGAREAISYSGYGKIVIGEGAEVTSKINESYGTGTINLSMGMTDIAILEINCGIVENTGTGKAITSYSGGNIIVSGNSVVKNSSLSNGTIELYYYSKLEMTGGTIENTQGYAIRGDFFSDVKISIPSGNSIIKGGMRATNIVPDLGDDIEVIASKNYDGSSPQEYKPAEIDSYKYLEFKEKPAVAKIGDDSYSTIQKAFDNVKNNETIKLIDDIILSDTVTITETEESSRNFTLDLNGYSIDSANKTAITYNGDGDITITDGSESENGKITSSINAVNAIDMGTIRFNGTASLSINKGIIENTSPYNGTTIYNGASATVKISGGIVQSEGEFSRTIYNDNSSSLSVSGGIVQSNGSAIYHGSKGKISITETAEIISKNNSAIVIADSTYDAPALEISGGLVENTGVGTAILNQSSSGKISVSNNAKVISKDSSGTIFILSGIGKLEINNATVENTGNGTAINHGGTGKITVSGKSVIKSSNKQAYGRTIFLAAGTPSDTVLEINSGTIENTGGDYSIYNASSGKIYISNGGAVIKAVISAINKAPSLSDTEAYYIEGSKTSVNGEYSVQIKKTDINTDSKTMEYKYLKFEPAANELSAEVSINNTAPRIGDILSGLIENSNNTGALTYIWKADGTQVGSEQNYTVTVNELGKTISLEIESSIETGKVKGDDTEAVRKKSAPSAPEAPSVVSKSYDTIILKANSAYEFSKDKSTWQSSNVFSGLNESTAYAFYQRIASTLDTEESEVSVVLRETTDTAPKVPPIVDNNDGDNSGSSLGNNNIVTIILPAPDNPNSAIQAEIKISAAVDDKGKAIVNIIDKMIIEAFEKALDNAKKNGNEKNGITVVLRVDTKDKNVSDITVNLPKSVQDIVIENKIVSTIVIVDNPDIRIGMDLMTIKEINQQAKSDVNITVKRIDNSTLGDEAKKAVLSRSLFDLRVNYGNDKEVQNFGTGSVSISIPYTLALNEKAENIKAVYIDKNKKVQWIENSIYDISKKLVNFNTNHFSIYGVGYKEADIAFEDIANHWAKEDIEFAVNRGLFSCTSTSSFSPDIEMTRGMFVTVLGRMANADVSIYTESKFTDVKRDSYYMGYIEWANKNGIIKGISNEKFAPESAITREQIAFILQNYSKFIGLELPKVHGENTFVDSVTISSYAKDAVKLMQISGIIKGKDGNHFAPQVAATRAEVSSLLRRFIELISSHNITQD